MRSAILFFSDFFIDNHIHSDNSIDGKDSIMKICESAVEKKLAAITITDHCECNRYYKWGYYKSLYHSLFQIQKARSVFGDKLEVFSGIELGQPTHDLQAANEALACGHYDFVLATVHRVKGKNDFDVIDYHQEEIHELLDKYFDEVLKVVHWGKFDSLAHLTYPLRFASKKLNRVIEIDPYLEKINLILGTVAKENKAIEINTSGLQNNEWQKILYKNLLSKFLDFGGKYVTIGSDAHQCENIGNGIQDGIDLARACGLKNITLFADRKPNLISIM